MPETLSGLIERVTYHNPENGLTSVPAAATLEGMVDAPQRRWFVPTPGWLLIALLAAEGLLFLADRLRWLPKGYGVLLALASVGIVLLLMAVWFFAALIFRLRFQFSLRSLFVLVVAVALPCSWLAVAMQKAREQEAAVKAIPWQVWVRYDYESGDPFAGPEEPHCPALLRDLLGKDFFADVAGVNLANDTGVPDDKWQHLRQFFRLEELYLAQPHITDATLAHVKGLTHITTLVIGGSQVTDAGLENLTGMTNLQRLDLSGTQVTIEGVKKLQAALPNCEIRH